MATARQPEVRDIRALARRVHRRWLEYQRRHAGMSVPISDTLSRILEHVDDYRPLRPRAPHRRRPPLQNPGVFTLKAVAEALETTVGDLLGEPGYTSLRDHVSRDERRTLRDAVTLLRDLFDLDDELLAPAAAPAEEPAPFGIGRDAFILGDYDYPQPLVAWVVPEGAAIGEASRIREIHAPRFQVVRIVGEAMEPELRDGVKVLVDTGRTAVEEGALLAVYVRDGGGFVGRPRREHGTLRLERANPAAPPVVLGPADEWTVWGTVVSVIDAPVDIRR